VLHKSVTYLLRHLPTYLQPWTHTGHVAGEPQAQILIHSASTLSRMPIKLTTQSVHEPFLHKCFNTFCYQFLAMNRTVQTRWEYQRQCSGQPFISCCHM